MNLNLNGVCSKKPILPIIYDGEGGGGGGEQLQLNKCCCNSNIVIKIKQV